MPDTLSISTDLFLGKFSICWSTISFVTAREVNATGNSGGACEDLANSRLVDVKYLLNAVALHLG